MSFITFKYIYKLGNHISLTLQIWKKEDILWVSCNTRLDNINSNFGGEYDVKYFRGLWQN